MQALALSAHQLWITQGCVTCLTLTFGCPKATACLFPSRCSSHVCFQTITVRSSCVGRNKSCIEQVPEATFQLKLRSSVHPLLSLKICWCIRFWQGMIGREGSLLAHCTLLAKRLLPGGEAIRRVFVACLLFWIEIPMSIKRFIVDPW
jgi:hypothetical protein